LLLGSQRHATRKCEQEHYANRTECLPDNGNSFIHTPASRVNAMDVSLLLDVASLALN
jgi:hypothetical protein